MEHIYPPCVLKVLPSSPSLVGKVMAIPLPWAMQFGHCSDLFPCHSSLAGSGPDSRAKKVLFSELFPGCSSPKNILCVDIGSLLTFVVQLNREKSIDHPDQHSDPPCPPCISHHITPSLYLIHSPYYSA